MLKSYTDCYATVTNKHYGDDGSPHSDEPNSSSNLNSSIDESSQHSHSLSVASSSATPLGAITNKITNTNYPQTADSSAPYSGYSMYSGYHHSMVPTSSSSPSSSLAQAQYSLGSLADSCAVAAAAAAHWSNGRINSQFYANQTNSTSAVAAVAAAASMSVTSSSNQMLVHRLSHAHHHSNRNSIGSSSSAESSSTSLVDENSPVGTGFHHPTIPRYANISSANQVPQYQYNIETSSSQVQVGPTTPNLINAASILNRMSRPETSNQTGSGSLPIKKRRPVPVEHKDMNYWEKRRKNNESAKKSRDSKREKENHMALRISYLERENFELKTRCTCLIQENEKLTNMLIAAQNNSAQIPPIN